MWIYRYFPKSQSLALGYIQGDNKKNRIYNNFANELNTSQNDYKIRKFIEAIMAPAKYTNIPHLFENRRNEINKILLFMGTELQDTGIIKDVKKAETLSDVNTRIDELKSELIRRNIHSKVISYCTKEYLSEDYFHACFEAVKGIYDRLRDMTNLDLDGRTLIEKIFSKKEPIIIINLHQTITEIDENQGLGNLILSLHQMVRNPNAHTPRIKKETELEECLDILTMVSRVHKYLDISTRTCCI